MKIGIIRDTPFTNEPRGINIALMLQKMGFEIFVLCYGDQDCIEQHQGITIVRFRLVKSIRKKLFALVETIPIYKLLWAKKIISFAGKYQVDVLHIHDLYMMGAAVKAQEKLNLPIIVDYHENYVAAIQTYNWATSIIGRLLVRPNRWQWLEPKYLKHSSKIIVTCEEFKEVLLQKYSFLHEKDIIVYLNVPNIEEFSNYKIDGNVLQKDNSFFILYFGVLGERRGVFTCFEALRLLITRYDNIKLLLIGPVDRFIKNQFHEYLHDPQIGKHVIYIPWIDIKLLPSYVNISDICVSPLLKNDHHETTIANKIFQYMLLEKSLVVSDCKPQQKIVEEEECGLVFKSGDPKELAEKITQLYENPALSKRMGLNGKRAVEKKYNWDKANQTVLRMYQNLELSESELLD